MRYILAYSIQFLIRIRIVLGNVVMAATDIYGKALMGVDIRNNAKV